MSDAWNETRLNQLIANATQENSSLEYKQADALGTSSGKKKEIAKDISAMANGAGGVVIYGVAEYQQEDRRHLPERIDAVDLTQFSREWLDQVINSNIRPRIEGIRIHPIALAGQPHGGAFAIEIPQSKTAHQVTTDRDYRYYRRYNFEVLPMEDFEVRDVMNRAAVPSASIELGLTRESDEHGQRHYRRLRIAVRNDGVLVINKYKVEVTITDVRGYIDEEDEQFENVSNVPVYDKTGIAYYFTPSATRGKLDIRISFQSQEVLFPGEKLEIGHRVAYLFDADGPYEERYDEYGVDMNDEQWLDFSAENRWKIKWRLFADSMPPKEGEVSVAELPVIAWPHD